MKFHAGQVLTHRKGGTYVVVLTPDVCVLEETRESAYAYLSELTKKIHVRRSAEMEDGRFTLLDAPPETVPSKIERRTRIAKPLPEIPPEFNDDINRLIANDAAKRVDGKIADSIIEQDMKTLRLALERKGVHALRQGIDTALGKGLGVRYAAGCVRNASGIAPLAISRSPVPKNGFDPFAGFNDPFAEDETP